jgi:hypothetical protein
LRCDHLLDEWISEGVQEKLLYSKCKEKLMVQFVEKKVDSSKREVKCMLILIEVTEFDLWNDEGKREDREVLLQRIILLD